MEIRSILVNVDLDTSNSNALRYAVDLAETFGARLIGVAADQPNLSVVGYDGGGAAQDFYVMERAEIETQLKRAEETFRGIVPAAVKTEWRGYVADPVAAIVEAARAADLIVTGSKTTTAFRQTEEVNLGAIVLAAGRPVIEAANVASRADLDSVMIAWKDTREARRAVADALPFLKLAKEVVAVTISEGDYNDERRSLDDLLAWLGHHGVAARADVISNPDKFVDILESTALAREVDLLVSGGYGHSRMREWLLGGMTRSLLSANRLNRLFSN